MIKVTKRDGSSVPFCKDKIITAIKKANREVSAQNQATDKQIKYIVDNIDESADEMSVEEIQDAVESGLIEFNKYQLAKKYIIYRYRRSLNRVKNTTDDSILNLVNYDNEDVMRENSNKDAYIASTQRDLIAGEVSKDLTKRVLLPENIVQAHMEGILHFHDMDYFLQKIMNCCLINIGDMLDNGTVMNGKMVETPKSFQVACTVTTQIIAAVACGQYGGQSVNIKHLGKYLRISKEKFERKTREACPQLNDNEVDAIVKSRLQDELESGVQTIQYQINTIMSSNGQTPFVTLFLDIDPGSEYECENAAIIYEILRQRLQGLKNEQGVWVTPTFPKLVYPLYEENNLSGGKFDFVTKLAAKCSAKRMYPDYISSKQMKEIYEGQVFSCMGCVAGHSIIRAKMDPDEIIQESFTSFWNQLAEKFEIYEQTKGSENLYMDLSGVKIYDSKRKEFVECKRIIRNVSREWKRIRFENGHSIDCTPDHPFFTVNRGRVLAQDLQAGDSVYFSDWIFNRDDNFYETKITDIFSLTEKKYSYDVTTESDFFEVSGMYSHNCRSFLSPWKDENGKYKWEGRFNQGVVTINLPQIGIIANGNENEFWKLLDERLELCRQALMCRHKALKGTPSDISPIHWQHGALARLKKGEVIDKYLEGGYSTLSLGYIGIYEMTYAMKGVSHTDPVGEEFAVRVMKYLKKTTVKWREESGLGFSLYGSPAESLCYRLAEIDKKKFGELENITDKGYYTNSYHVDVREKIDAFRKLEFESQFQKISTGGCISYIEIPNMQKNISVMEDLIKFIYEHIQYAEFNTKSDYCMVCGYDGEIIINDNNEWECPQCHNKNQRLMNVTRRTCGYLGSNYWNEGKTKEIKSRVLHL